MSIPHRASIRILGVMTGTSCDGLDASCLEFSSKLKWRLCWSQSVAYPKALRRRVLAIQLPNTPLSSQHWLALDRDLGDWYGRSLKQIIESQKKSERPELIANHGQTVAHFAHPRSKGFTLQLGNPARISQITQLSVASHFRDGDMAAGGNGAPLVPLFHQALATQLDPWSEGIAIHNLGGISNFTYICSGYPTFASDTGPGNIWIDAAIQKLSQGRLHMDRGGKHAKQGKLDLRALEYFLRLPFFSKSAPKATGRDDFPIPLFFSPARFHKGTWVKTATELSIQSIARAYRKTLLEKGYPLKKIFLCGGGAENHTLCEGIQTQLPEVQVIKLQAAGLDPQFVEAQAFAFLGYKALMGEPLGGVWTKAHGFGPPASLTIGKNWPHLLEKIMKHQNSKSAKN